jgi:hypothetical protein
MRLFFVFIFGTCSLINLFAQEQLGLHTGTYSGIGGAIYNPAAFQAGALDWDFSMLSGGAFAETDYIYVVDATVFDLFSRDLYPIDPTTDQNQVLLPHERAYVFTNSARPMSNSVSSFVGLPAAAVRINRKMSLGVFARTRQAFSANNIDAFWSYPRLVNWNEGEQRTSAPIWLSGLLWTEMGAHVAREFKIRSNRLTVGLNARFLIGHESVFAFVPNSLDMTLNPESYAVDAPVAYYGFTDFENGTDLSRKGTGAAFDLGIVYQIPDEDRGYSWQFSASLNDLGWIDFNRDAQYHVIASNELEQIDRAALDAITGVEDFVTNVSTDIYGDPTASRQRNAYTLFMPTALSFGVDHQIRKNVFVQGSFTRRMLLHPQQLQRDNIWVLSARYETRFFEVGVPFVLFNDVKPRMGTWLRIGPLTIGSDHILTWFVPQKRLSGSDVYFSIRLNESFFRSEKPGNPDKCYW